MTSTSSDRTSPSIPATPRPRLALALLAAVNFMVVLDSQIVILAIPSLSVSLSADVAAAQWAMGAYLLGFGGLLLVGGRLGDRFGQRRVFTTGTVLFVVASLACGLATDLGFLITARAVHGVSAALMAPTALALLLTIFTDPSARNRALAIWGGVGGVGATAALLVGGVVTDVLGWEWVFFLNVPVGAVLLVLSPRLLPDGRTAVALARLDVAGAVTLTVGVGAVCLAVTRAPDLGWRHGGTVATLAAAVASFACFTWVEHRAVTPLVPLGMFRSRALTFGNAVMFLMGMAAWGVGLATSLYAQSVLGFSPLGFGLGTAVLTVAAVVGSYAAQAALSRRGLRTVLLTATAVAAVGVALLTGVSPDGSYAVDLLPGLALFGLGLGASTVAASVAALLEATGAETGLRAAITTAAFQLGGAVGAAVVGGVIALATAAGGGDGLSDGIAAGFVAAGAMVLASTAASALVRPGPAATGPGDSPGDDEAAVAATVRGWLASISLGDLDGVLRDHAEDLVMFDVPPPADGVRGLAAYEATWPPFLEWIRREGRFELHSLEVEADRTLALARALVRCENRAAPSDPPDHLRLTLGLRKVDERWLICHEHHSFADSARSG